MQRKTFRRENQGRKGLYINLIKFATRPTHIAQCGNATAGCGGLPSRWGNVWRFTAETVFATDNDKNELLSYNSGFVEGYIRWNSGRLGRVIAYQFAVSLSIPWSLINSQFISSFPCFFECILSTFFKFFRSRFFFPSTNWILNRSIFFFKRNFCEIFAKLLNHFREK